MQVKSKILNKQRLTPKRLLTIAMLMAGGLSTTAMAATPNPAACIDDGNIWSIGNGGGIGTYNISSATSKNIGGSADISDIGWGADGNLYGIQNNSGSATSTPTFYKINPSTGTATSLGTVNLGTSVLGWNGLGGLPNGNLIAMAGGHSLNVFSTAYNSSADADASYIYIFDPANLNTAAQRYQLKAPDGTAVFSTGDVYYSQGVIYALTYAPQYKPSGASKAGAQLLFTIPVDSTYTPISSVNSTSTLISANPSLDFTNINNSVFGLTHYHNTTYTDTNTSQAVRALDTATGVITTVGGNYYTSNSKAPYGLSTRPEPYGGYCPPSITLQKTTVGGIGTFSFNGDNGFTPTTSSPPAPSGGTAVSITTTAANAPVAATKKYLWDSGISATITEGALPSANWAYSGVTCTVDGSATSLSTTGTAPAFTISSSDIQNNAGKNITCTVKNTFTPNPALTCSTTAYGLYSTVGNVSNLNTLGYLDSNGVLQKLASIPSGSNNTATLAVSNDGNKAYITFLGDGTNNTVSNYSYLQVYDVPSGTWGTPIQIPGSNITSTSVPGPVRLYRMATSNDGQTVYIGAQDKLWSFPANSPSSIGNPKTVAFTPPTSGYNPAPSMGTSNYDVSGDFIFDNSGNLYLFASVPGNNMIDIMRINNTNSNSPTAEFIGRIIDSKVTAASGNSAPALTGVAALPSGILGATLSGQVININMSSYTATSQFAANSTRVSTDLSTCYYPQLAPIINSSKKVEKIVNGNATSLDTTSTVKAGDILQYTITTRNTGTLGVSNLTLQDAIPTGTTYILGTTTLNGAAIADATGGIMPFATTREIHGYGQGSGVLIVDTTPANTTDNESVVVFRVKVNDSNLPATISNQGTVTYTTSTNGTPTTTTTTTDNPGTTTPNDPTVVNSSTPPNIKLRKYVRNTANTTELYNFTGTGLPGNVLQYCIAFYNSGGPADKFVLTDIFPKNTSNWTNFVYIPSFSTPDGTIPTPSVTPSDAAAVISPSNPDWTILKERPSTVTLPTGITYNQTSFTVTDANNTTKQVPGIKLDFGTTQLPAQSKGAICFDATIN